MKSCDRLVTAGCLLTLHVLISGCGFVSFEDVSSQPEYSTYVGKHYRSTQSTEIYRISMDQNYRPEPSVYVVMGLPGISGPEVLTRAELPVGTTFQVLKVMRCTDCYLDFKERIHVVVKLTSISLFNDREIQVDYDLLGGTFVEVANTQERS
jgi:hypothetical protein